MKKFKWAVAIIVASVGISFWALPAGASTNVQPTATAKTKALSGAPPGFTMNSETITKTDVRAAFWVQRATTMSGASKLVNDDQKAYQSATGLSLLAAGLSFALMGIVLASMMWFKRRMNLGLYRQRLEAVIATVRITMKDMGHSAGDTLQSTFGRLLFQANDAGNTAGVYQYISLQKGGAENFFGAKRRGDNAMPFTRLTFVCLTTETR